MNKSWKTDSLSHEKGEFHIFHSWQPVFNQTTEQALEQRMYLGLLSWSRCNCMKSVKLLLFSDNQLCPSIFKATWLFIDPKKNVNPSMKSKGYIQSAMPRHSVFLHVLFGRTCNNLLFGCCVFFGPLQGQLADSEAGPLWPLETDSVSMTSPAKFQGRITPPEYDVRHPSVRIWTQAPRLKD